MKPYRYVGDIKKLTPAGWKFQLMYANDYKAYHKGDIFMFVISKMVLEISNTKTHNGEQGELIHFILKNADKPDDFWESPYLSEAVIKLFGPGTRPNYAVHTGKVRTKEEVMCLKRDFYKAFDVSEDVEYVPDGVLITLKLVKDILELHNLGGLEQVEVKKNDSKRA